MSKKTKGNLGEARAADFLVQHGLLIVERNFRIEGGEIDIIASHPSGYIFVEVKFRSDENFAAALEQVTPAQCRRVRFTAQHFLLQKGLDQHRLKLRFDVITVTGHDASINWLKDAF